MPTSPLTTARQDALAIWNAAVDSVRVRPLVASQFDIDQDGFSISDYPFLRADIDRIIVVGGGKASGAMASGLVDKLNGRIPITGWVNVPEGTAELTSGTTGKIHIHPSRPASVNEPMQAGVEGTQAILRLVQSATPRDLCIALISGGGSALLPAPRSGISLADKLAVTRWLSSRGADITELNTVRKHLSEIKGGGLLHACHAGELVTLVLSDVLGDPLDMIASGPTVEDTTTQTDALAVLHHFDPDHQLPDAVYRLLQSEPPPRQPPQCRATTIVIGNNAVAVDEAGIVAERLGYNHIMHSANGPEASAEEVGRKHAEMLISMLRSNETHKANCLITGGEPVVCLAPESIRGLGGRNQQLVLAAYQFLRGSNLSDADWQRIAVLSGGTDGEDGPTDAAGAFLDAAVHQSAVEQSLDIEDALRRNDAYNFFRRCGGLIQTGPTGTNVCDVRVGLVKNDTALDEEAC
ncbi:putative hydroxypyruvate reductase [Planctomycetes bacterium CA13]|uniref:Putative hydroxypyruvate reductase n=1 Tax=Novipirellula herctigrandis TaxID=2527986 RepID=A0A5C5YNJ3_9BACT|nr:putative hydroxypyruvate reductase [Planctomycetes bacterium CA13]